MEIDLGGTYPLSTIIRDVTGAPVDGTSVVVTVTLPDLTTATPAVTHGAVGNYSAYFPTTQGGRHVARWSGMLGTTPLAVREDFDVVPLSRVAVATDLATYLSSPDLDTDRATQILGLAQDLCETIVSPLPVTARSVVLGVAARAFNNVTSAHSVGIGSANVSYGSQGSSTGVGGLYLSRSDIRTLRLLAGRGGAFSIDPTPADAGEGLMPWDQNVTWLTGVPLAEDQRR